MTDKTPDEARADVGTLSYSKTLKFSHVSQPGAPPQQLALETLKAAILQLQATSNRLEELASQELGAYMLPPYFRAAAAIMTAVQEMETQIATVEELIRRVDKHR